MSYQRKHRGKTQNIFLIESVPPTIETINISRSYIIMGSTGNIYTVTIKKDPTCTCPDYVTRANRCKHIYFVLIRVMNTNEDKDTYSSTDLVKMFANSLLITDGIEANTEIKQTYDKLKQGNGLSIKPKFQVNSKGLDDLCPICLDDLENGDELDYCKYSCGKPLHKNCFSMWIKVKKSVCVYCKQNWYENDPDEKYVNIINIINK